MKDRRDADLEIEIRIQILEHTCQTGILLHLQSSETTKLPGTKKTYLVNSYYYSNFVLPLSILKTYQTQWRLFIPWIYMGIQSDNSLLEIFQETAASLPTFCQRMKQL